MSEVLTPTSNLRSAICLVMAEIHRLEKAGTNAFDKYNFTSIDDFKDMVRPLIAKYGLDMAITETSLEMTEYRNKSDKMTVTAKIGFDIQLSHKSGEELKPDHTTITLPYVGAQTAGIAKSYAIKEWIKGRFLASSGDTSDEADMRAQDEFTSKTLSKKDARPLFEALQKELREVIEERNPGALLQWAQDNREHLLSLPVDWRGALREEYAKGFDEAKANENLDKKPHLTVLDAG